MKVVFWVWRFGIPLHRPFLQPIYIWSILFEERRNSLLSIKENTKDAGIKQNTHKIHSAKMANYYLGTVLFIFY